MIKNIQRVGGSLGVTLPTREIREYLGINQGDPVYVITERGEVRIIPLNRKPQVEEVQQIASGIMDRYALTLQELYHR